MGAKCDHKMPEYALYSCWDDCLMHVEKFFWTTNFLKLLSFVLNDFVWGDIFELEAKVDPPVRALTGEGSGRSRGKGQGCLKTTRSRRFYVIFTKIEPTFANLQHGITLKCAGKSWSWRLQRCLLTFCLFWAFKNRETGLQSQREAALSVKSQFEAEVSRLEVEKAEAQEKLDEWKRKFDSLPTSPQKLTG